MSNTFQLIPEGVTVPEGAVMELVAFTVKDEAQKSYVSTQKEIHDFVSTFDGYISSIALKGLEAPKTFVDMVLWDSLEDAKTAAKAFEAWPACGSVMEKISEMKVMTHLRAA